MGGHLKWTVELFTFLTHCSLVIALKMLHTIKKVRWLKSGIGRDLTKRAILDIMSLVSGQNYDILASNIAQLLMSWPFPELCQLGYNNSYRLACLIQMAL